mmetsp:Transcript_26480/g.61632  ORF Transcript_26480/g.61632 Transcript_26480/m.61632 type:complete len:95 (-) Transcript_26480:11-295(-)
MLRLFVGIPVKRVIPCSFGEVGCASFSSNPRSPDGYPSSTLPAKEETTRWLESTRRKMRVDAITEPQQARKHQEGQESKHQVAADCLSGLWEVR